MWKKWHELRTDIMHGAVGTYQFRIYGTYSKLYFLIRTKNFVQFKMLSISSAIT